MRAAEKRGTTGWETWRSATRAASSEQGREPVSWPKVAVVLPTREPPKLGFRRDESERRRAARGDGALEPSAGLWGVSAHEVPVADAVAQRRNRDVARVGRGEHGVGADLTSVQAK